jgi:hypothetical protein
MLALDAEGINYKKEDADVGYDESTMMEQLLDTKNYPIIEVLVDREVIYFVNESFDTQQVAEGIYKQSFISTPQLIKSLKFLYEK